MKIVLRLIVIVVILIAGAVMAKYTGLKRPIKKLLSMASGPEPVLVAPSRREGISILFLHHSTGGRVWNGGVAKWIKTYNRRNATSYNIVEQAFPKSTPYGWNNYPYDYWNIWINHQGDKSYMREPTLEMITARYAVIIFKHCFPVGKILEDTGESDVASQEKRIENYQVQYNALKAKMHQYYDKKFIIWTGAALVRGVTDEAEATRARAFFDWVKNEWDEPRDNIFLWDFYELETGGELYMKDEYAAGPTNSHPNLVFCKKVATLFAQRIVDVIEGRGDSASSTGEK